MDEQLTNTGEAQTASEQEEVFSAEPETDASKDQSCNEILAAIDGLGEKLDNLESLFKKKIDRTNFEATTYKEMHDDLENARTDMYSQLVRPILQDIIEVRNDILSMSAVFEAKPESEQKIPLKTFRDYSVDLKEILEKNGITVYRDTPGDTFDSRKQKNAKSVIVNDKELNGKVAEIITDGYEYKDSPISKENVAVYVYREPENEKGEV